MNLKSSKKPIMEKIAYVEMYVGNIFTSKFFFLNALKFEYLSQKIRGNIISYLLKQGDIYLVLSSSLEEDSPLSKHIGKYGDSIKKISFWVRDAKACFDASFTHGAKASFFPQEKDGTYTASIEMFNEVEHEFMQISSEVKIPGFEYSEAKGNKSSMLFNIDHIATCHPVGSIGRWVEFYKEAFGFSENKNEDIYSEESGMHIIIMKSPNGNIKLPLVEPSSDKSPLHTYLKYNHGSGVHHIAFETNNIIDAVKHYEQKFGELRKAPPQYYKKISESNLNQFYDVEAIANIGVMLEQDVHGVLFQIFTKPIVTRPTFFLEFLQRDKCEGFGTSNIQALYQTLEN